MKLAYRRVSASCFLILFFRFCFSYVGWPQHSLDIGRWRLRTRSDLIQIRFRSFTPVPVDSLLTFTDSTLDQNHCGIYNTFRTFLPKHYSCSSCRWTRRWALRTCYGDPLILLVWSENRTLQKIVRKPRHKYAKLRDLRWAQLTFFHGVWIGKFYEPSVVFRRRSNSATCKWIIAISQQIQPWTTVGRVYGAGIQRWGGCWSPVGAGMFCFGSRVRCVPILEFGVCVNSLWCV